MNLLNDDEVLSGLAQHRVPGASITVMDGNEVVWRGLYGLRDVASAVPVDAATRFQLASLTKTVTGLLFMTLARDGVVNLDAPANAYLRTWRLEGPDADLVTIAMLLSHTGGTSVFGFWGYIPGTPIPTLEQVLAGEPPANSEAIRVVRRPGAEISYSGGGTTVLQKLAGDVTGSDYASLARERILEPLGMRHSGIEQPPPAGTTNIALGHDRDGRVVEAGYRIHPELAAAGLWSTGEDFALLLAAIMASTADDDGALVPRPLAQRMITPLLGDAALGAFSQAPGTFNHAGGNVGYRAHYVADSKTGRAIITMCNGDDGAAPLRALRQTICDRMGWVLPGDPPA